MLVWPYAVATMVAGVLWLFMFNPNIGRHRLVPVTDASAWSGTTSLKSGQAFLLVTLAASWKQISYNFVFFLAGLQSVPAALVEAAEIDGAEPHEPLLGHRVPPAFAHHLLPGGHERRVRLFRDLPDHPPGHPGRTGPGHEHPGLQGLQDGFINLDLSGSAAQSVVLMVIVVVLTVVQFRFVERRVTY